MRQYPSISVIIPTYNRASTITRAIDSVLSQTISPLEVIVVDDGSTDETVCVVHNYQDSRIKCIPLSTNQGAQHARIIGIQRAIGDFIAFLDSDDEWFNDSLELRLESFFENGFDTGLVYGDARFNDPQGEIFGYKKLSGFKFSSLLNELSLCPYSVMMISRKCFETSGLPSVDFPSWQDDDMVLTVGRMFPVHHCGSVVAIMHRSQNCISLNKYAVYEGCRKIVAKYAADIIKYCGYLRYFLWKLRVVNSFIVYRLNKKTVETSRVKFDLETCVLKVVHKTFRVVLRLCFDRVNS